MPGSPPTRTSDPATMPPPSTRSNSGRPDDRRGSSAPVRLGSSTGSVRGPSRRAVAAERGAGRTSAKVFHEAQPGQRPSHLRLSWPHSEQAKVVRAGLVLTLAIGGIMACRSAAGQRRDGTHPQKWRADAARSDSTYRILGSLCLPPDLSNVFDLILDS